MMNLQDYCVHSYLSSVKGMLKIFTHQLKSSTSWPLLWTRFIIISTKVYNSKQGEKKYDTSPKYKINDLISKAVHHMTGQVDLFSFLEVLIIISGGSIDLMAKTDSTRTWLEIWLLFFRFQCGRTHIRWETMQTVMWELQRQEKLRRINKGWQLQQGKHDQHILL